MPTQIIKGNQSLNEFSSFLEKKNYRKYFVLIDENSHQHCLPLLLNNVPQLAKTELLEVESGEGSKILEIANQLWLSLSELHANRNDLFINLGGGVITDLGGFVASTFKRGVPFVNIPTTLLAQVDAAIGGKTGIDLGELKNMVGSYAHPETIVIEPEFLKSLPLKQVKSGFAEIIKLWAYSR